MTLLGNAAPQFKLPSSDGGSVALTGLRGKKVVLFFYPKDNTPGCTLEAQGFTQARYAFAAQNAVVLGISKDSIASHCKFRDKYSLTIPLLADESGATIAAYGAWGKKNMYGNISEGIIRSTFLIDEIGTVIKEWRGVKVAGHVEAVLDAVNGASVREIVAIAQVPSKLPGKSVAKAKPVAKKSVAKKAVAKKAVAKKPVAKKAVAKKPVAKKAVAKKAVAKKAVAKRKR